MREQKSKRTTIIIVLLCILAMIGAVYICFYDISKNLETEMQNTLCDVAEQNNVAVQKEIDARFQLLYSIAQEAGENPEEVTFLLEALKSVVNSYQFTRIGYIDSDGMAYTTDGYKQDMSPLDFYRQGMAGNATLTDGVDDMVEQEQKYVSRFGVPVYNENHTEIMGVLFATYQTEWFEGLLNTQAFEGKGYSCIIKADGEVIAHSPGSPLYGVKNFFSGMEGEDKDFIDAMQSGSNGTGRFRLEAEQNFYYMPLHLENGELDWYMITVVPTEVLTTRLRPIMTNVEQMLIIIMILVACGISIFLLYDQVNRKQLIKLAYTDSLTQGDNIACFQEKIKRKKGVRGYLVAMDLSEFKIINNTCGVAMGDEVLSHVWRVIHNSIREEELAARIYADRFIMFLVEEEKENVKKRLNQLVSHIKEISEILNIPRVVPVLGIHETTNQEQVENDYGKAVQAKHLVKGRRDRNYAFYEELDYNQILEKRVMEDEFDQALEERQFEVWYQPRYDAENGEIVGAEALIRWRKADGTLLTPFKFIPIFEKNGMIPRLDEYVFRTVCVQQKQWQLEGKKILPVSVNISRVSLYYYNIVEKYKNISDENELETKYLQLEITESATIDNAEISNLIDGFHNAGFKMLLDDFGSGYSSLSSLNMMHFDTMKLDKSLIDYIGDENGEKLLHYIMRLGQNLGLHITAEGVETKEQLEFLRKLKCDDIQGYYFSKPLHVKEFEKLLG